MLLALYHPHGNEGATTKEVLGVPSGKLSISVSYVQHRWEKFYLAINDLQIMDCWDKIFLSYVLKRTQGY